MTADEKASDELGESGRGYITPTEESVLVDGVTRSGEEAERDYVRVVESRIRSRLEHRLESDLDILASNMPDEYDEFVETVREHSLETGREWRGGLKPLNDEMVRQAVTARAASESGVDADDVGAVLDAVVETLAQFNAKDDESAQ
jgi:hypothetical protein